jgi:FtsP/CotA-like multicopper oxidase with cupredoxin domain
MSFQKIRVIFVIIVGMLMLSFALAFAVVGQTPLDPNTLTKYLDPLPVPAKLDGTLSQIVTISISEFTQKVLPSNFTAGPYGGKTLTWGYNKSYPGPTLEARRDVPLHVRFLNSLPDIPGLQALLPIDQTLNWANPLNGPQSFQRYSGPQPVVAHLHGGEVPSAFDGNPASWFTPAFGIKGPEFVSETYTYPNSQEAATLWYHDHALGITRLNVYAGLAGFYLLRDPANEPANLPSGPYEREIVIQDKMFDTNGQILYPDKGQNPSVHPFWFPKFMGDTIVVNGKVWPYLNVEPRRYRFRLLNGSIARIYTLQLQTTGGQAGPSFWQIGTDGGLLNRPIRVSQVTIGPGERADVIVDFAGKQGTSFILKNTNSSSCRSSFGSAIVSQIMKVNVSLPLNGTDTSLNPATGPNLRPNNPIVNLSATVTSSTPTRHLTLAKNRDSGAFLLNGKFFDDPITEKPRVGATEVWQIDNSTGDTHPIHLHLIQFQVLNGGGCCGSDPNANGWKDTIRVPSWGSVSIVARWAPQDTPAGAVQPGQNLFPFDPTATMGTTDIFSFPGGPGYVWHCHILDHEDNEMMRPYVVLP